MFDLFRSRDKAVRILLTAILSLVAISMVGYLIPGYGGSGANSTTDTVVADIGGDKVTVRDVQRAIRAATRNREMPAEMLQHYIPQIIDEMINEKAMAYQASRMGMKVTEAETAKAIRESMPQLFPDGKFVGKESYAAFLAQQDMSIPDFEEYTAAQVLLNRLRNVILESTVVSKADIDQEFKLRNEKASIEYVKIDPEQLKDQVKVTPEEMQAFFEKNKANFRIPEKRALKLVVLDPAKISENVNVSDEQVRRAYDQNKDRYRLPERVKARHILLMTTGKTPEEDAKIKAKADDLLKQLKAGANFADVAKKNSEDPGSKDKGGDLDWVMRQQTVPEFEQALFALKPNEISGVVKTQYGYHIIQSLGKEEARLRPFDEVKAELATETKKQIGQQQVQTTIDNAVAALKKNPQQVDQIAAQNRLTVVNVDKAGPGDPLPDLGVNKDFEDSIAGLKKGEVSQPVAAPGDRMVLAIVTDVFPPHPATFEEAQSQIRPSVMQEKGKALADQRVADMEAKLKAMNGDFKKAAQAAGLTVVTSAEFNRTGNIEGLGSPTGLPDIFTKPVGSVFGPSYVGISRVFGKITSRTPPDMAELATQTESIRDEIKRTKARERNALFEDGLRQQLMKEGKIKIHSDVLKRLTSDLRG